MRFWDSVYPSDYLKVYSEQWGRPGDDEPINTTTYVHIVSAVENEEESYPSIFTSTTARAIAAELIRLADEIEKGDPKNEQATGEVNNSL
jgi:hypothetical protein